MAMIDPKEVQQYLVGIEYPVTSEELITYATDQGAGEDVLMALQGLDDEMVYESLGDVSSSLGEIE